MMQNSCHEVLYMEKLSGFDPDGHGEQVPSGRPQADVPLRESTAWGSLGGHRFVFV